MLQPQLKCMMHYDYHAKRKPTLKPMTCSLLAIFLDAFFASSSEVVPVQTIFPDDHMYAVQRGFLSRITTF